MLFKGTPNASVQKNVQPSYEEDEDGFIKPMGKSLTEKQREEERQRCKILNEYTAFEWENLDQESERKWYDYDEDDIGNSQVNDWGGDVLQNIDYKIENVKKKG